MRPTHRPDAGFTLIELMIVVAIIGILFSIAVYVYRDFQVRGQISEGITLATTAQRAIALYHAEYDSLPSSNVEAGLEAASSIKGTYVERVDVNVDGEVVVRFGNKASSVIAGASNECTFVPVSNSSGNLRWDVACGFPERLLPKSHRD